MFVPAAILRSAPEKSRSATAVPSEPDVCPDETQDRWPEATGAVHGLNTGPTYELAATTLSYHFLVAPLGFDPM